ncbi:MAG: 1-(5-phosphoribosyl)-5-[(5-phosphoribosylamino)methylideneamino]imidazole-4-carboxamide isomerase [Schleiferiaceae bacterium]|nr:1-(5-phosphoribosyl)-5-[(5-phosphoribosylamino)methylideneamino]imidazole-4-carboxamide isomerase [Schleiferiaceae bacterium]
MKYIPAIDLYNGQCVRLHKGDFNRLTHYSSDPLAVAATFEKAGFSQLHIVDLNGASGDTEKQQAVIQQLCQHTKLSVQLGGGIKNAAAVDRAFANGVSRVIIGSMAVKKPMWIRDLVQQYGSEKIILGFDLKGRAIAVSGWKETAESDYRVVLRQLIDYGIREVICTQIEKDGTLAGPDVALYQSLLSEFPIALIASGGIRSVADIDTVAQLGCTGVILGKSLYEKTIDLSELTKRLTAC